GDTAERQRRAAVAPGELLGAFRGAIGDERDRGASRGQALDRELARLAGAYDEHGAPAKLAEDLLRERGCSRRHGCRALADRRLRARLLAGVQGVAEEAVEDRARGAEMVRAAHLAEDLALARHHRVEP